MRRHWPNHWRGAFTLFEVLVSLAIFALAAVMLGATYVNVLSSYDALSRRNQHDQDLALLRAALLAEPDREQAERGGAHPLPGDRTADWSCQIEEAELADLFSVSFRCEIHDRARGGQPWVHEETFMLLRPTWSDPAVRDKLRQATRERLERLERKEAR